MSQEDNNLRILGFPQATAASVGAIIIYVSQSGAFGKEVSQILIYLAPVVSALTGGVLCWVESSVKEFLLGRRIRSKFKKVIDDGKELLKDDDLDADSKSAISAAINQARLAYMNRNLYDFHSDLKPLHKTPAPKGGLVNKPQRRRNKADVAD